MQIEFEVVDPIDLSRISQALAPDPQVMLQYPDPGVLAVLNPTGPALQLVSPPIPQTVVVRYPDGERVELVVHHFELSRGVLAAYFASVSKNDIPRLSRFLVAIRD